MLKKVTSSPEGRRLFGTFQHRFSTDVGLPSLAQFEVVSWPFRLVPRWNMVYMVVLKRSETAPCPPVDPVGQILTFVWILKVSHFLQNTARRPERHECAHHPCTSPTSDQRRPSLRHRGCTATSLPFLQKIRKVRGQKVTFNWWSFLIKHIIIGSNINLKKATSWK